MPIKANIDVSKWEKEFKTSAEKTIQKGDRTLQHVAKEVFDRAVRYTPVGNPALWHPPYWPKGYVPGQLRQSWVSINKPFEVVMYNFQPYALRVEFGWSSQAPEGMLRRALQSYPILMQKYWTSFKI